ncbi:uncharacterized protein KNAG_0F03640 [Huiozyma naganishii CBS 8797]|uniref:VanZ-like domain-containing protein n=1 Tax=Huiozyma naganishii (strain ATCC MYA-139 / BCRC 22969 / CBS 8797 / KCTC 17520 / NBRC 10181 / NCYC 3082 / Yp74L-3) TaxID=1071383 RepID=J7S8Q2_HUIN7|nr:hypothetical protein KNAG_0F03640 [Kazachstania naganishii CBS 8797]CCK71026.1 hypothetical protein KNAG_0F03640 [Kazachstania naganishii CBS 8797]
MQFRKRVVTLLALNNPRVSCTLGLGTSLPGPISAITSQHDKLVHFFAFLGESLLFVLSFPRGESLRVPLPQWLVRRWPAGEDLSRSHTPSQEWDKYAVAAVLFALVGSIASEFLQFAVTRGRRNFDPRDMCANTLGSLVGLLLARGVETL